MDLAATINQLKPLIEELQKQYPDVMASNDDLFYNHGYEVMGMLLSGNLDFDKLPNPKPDMEVFQSQLHQTVPVEQQLFEYVASSKPAMDAYFAFWSMIESNFDFTSTFQPGTDLILSRMFVPSLRQVILKRCASAIPILYAPELSVVFNDLQMLNDSSMVIEQWTSSGFIQVSGPQLFQMVMQESLRPVANGVQAPHAQTVDDFQFKNRFVLPSKIESSNGQLKTHYFDAILAKKPGVREQDIIDQR